MGFLNPSASQTWQRPDALIGFNDPVAIGAIKELLHQGVRVPQDLAVVGIDGGPIGLIVTPELTTLRLDMETMGAAAVDLVIGMADGSLPLRGESVHQHVAHTLVRRDSA